MKLTSYFKHTLYLRIYKTVLVEPGAVYGAVLLFGTEFETPHAFYLSDMCH